MLLLLFNSHHDVFATGSVVQCSLPYRHNLSRPKMTPRFEVHNSKKLFEYATTTPEDKEEMSLILQSE